MDNLPARDAAFAALALLRCRDRLEQVLSTIAEPRRSEIERAVGEFSGFDDDRIKHELAKTIRGEDEALEDSLVEASPGLRRLIARGAWA